MTSMTSAWKENNIFGTLRGAQRAYNNAHQQLLYINSASNYDTVLTGPTYGQWATIDVSKTFYGVPTEIPPDANAILLSGILIISPGYAALTADLQLYIRELGDTDPAYMCAQCVANSPTNGARTNFATVVPLVNRKFEMWWNRSTYAPWPDEPRYGLIAWPVMYFRMANPDPELFVT